MLDDLDSLVSLSGIISGIIGSIVAAIVVAALLYLWRALRKFVSSSAKANRQYAINDIRKRVRSDEYHSERQKVEIHALVIGAGSIIVIVSMLPLYKAGDEDGVGIWIFVLLLFVSGLLFYLETRYNAAALQIRMRREQRKRMKQLKQRREAVDATHHK